MQQTQPALKFKGTPGERELLERVFQVARFQGRLFGDEAPIRLPREQLLDFLAARGEVADREALAATLDSAIDKNRKSFVRYESPDGAVVYITTRQGLSPDESATDVAHMLRERFVPAADIAPMPVPKPRVQVAPAWALPPVFDEDEEGIDDEQTPAGDAVVVDGARVEPLSGGGAAGGEMVTDLAPRQDGVAPTDAARSADLPAADLSTAPLDDLRLALAAKLESDDRFVSFGDLYYSEDLVDRFGRNDIRRIKDYIAESNEPLSDEQLLRDLFGRRGGEATHQGARFSINYRLSRERRDFEFVGTRDARLWTIPTLAPIGTMLRKASELGQDYRYLLDEPESAPVGDTADHVVTFFEWTYGLLPLDGQLRQLFPQPYLEEQKSAVLRFEVPQLFVSFLVELRFPTANRGGYLVGLDEFYREYMVAGGRLTIARVPENHGQFVLSFQPVREEERVLHLDERRNRLVFRPHVIQCEVDRNWLLTESRFPRLANVKPLDDRERRRSELVVAAAFERVGENVGTAEEPRYWASPEDLMPVVNLERPFSLRALRDVLESPQYPQFAADADVLGAHVYTPSAVPARKSASKSSTRVDEDE